MGEVLIQKILLDVSHSDVTAFFEALAYYCDALPIKVHNSICINYAIMQVKPDLRRLHLDLPASYQVAYRLYLTILSTSLKHSYFEQLVCLNKSYYLLLSLTVK